MARGLSSNRFVSAWKGQKVISPLKNIFMKTIYREKRLRHFSISMRENYLSGSFPRENKFSLAKSECLKST